MNIRGRGARAGASFVGLLLFAGWAWAAVPGTVTATADASARPTQSAAQRTQAKKLLHAMPLLFVPNAGQADGTTLFVARGNGYELDLRRSALAVVPLSTTKTGAPISPIVLEFGGASPTPQL